MIIKFYFESASNKQNGVEEKKYKLYMIFLISLYKKFIFMNLQEINAHEEYLLLIYFTNFQYILKKFY